MRSKVGASFCMKSSKLIEWNILSISALRPRAVRVLSHMYLDGMIFRLTSVEYRLACESSLKMMLWGLDEWVLPLFRGLDDFASCFPLSLLLGPIDGWRLKNFFKKKVLEISFPEVESGWWMMNFMKVIWWWGLVWGKIWSLYVCRTMEFLRNCGRSLEILEKMNDFEREWMVVMRFKKIRFWVI